MPRHHLGAFWTYSDLRGTHGANPEAARNEKPRKSRIMNFQLFNGRKRALRAPLRPAHVKSVFYGMQRHPWSALASAGLAVSIKDVPFSHLGAFGPPLLIPPLRPLVSLGRSSSY